MGAGIMLRPFRYDVAASCSVSGAALSGNGPKSCRQSCFGLEPGDEDLGATLRGPARYPGTSGEMVARERCVASIVLGRSVGAHDHRDTLRRLQRSPCYVVQSRLSWTQPRER